MQFKQRYDERAGEQGSMLVGLVVAIFLILLALSVAAPTVAKELKREREVEAIHRANQYVRAIQLYTKRGQGPYPATIEQLEKTNNIRFLRQRYLNPMTGKADWRMIKVGEAKTTVKGFFGKPLTGLASSAGPGSAPSTPSTMGTPAGASGASPGFGSSSSGATSFGSSGGGVGGSGSSTDSGVGGVGSGSSGGFGGGSSGPGGPGTPGSASQPGSAGGMGGGAPFVGVGLTKEGDSIVVVNEQTTYKTWEFLYDPRIEQMKAQAGLMGGASNTSGAGASSMGTGSNPGSPGQSGFGSNSNGSTPFGSGSPSTTSPDSPTPH
jgi:type II secretory pathway pseudopilin PulG